MKGNDFKLKEGRFKLDIRKRFSVVRVVRHWHRLPEEAMDASCNTSLLLPTSEVTSGLLFWLWMNMTLMNTAFT